MTANEREDSELGADPPRSEDPDVSSRKDAKRGGYHFNKEITPILGGATPGGIARQTLDGLEQYFAQHNHRPSEQSWHALESIATTLERMCDGTCPPAIYLSSLDPGVGKTATIIQFLRTLLSSPLHLDVGVLISIQRREQIEAIASQSGLSKQDFAVYTSDKRLNALGARPKDARVLFTTHSMVERRCARRRFPNVREFWFGDRPRVVRIWDEALLPGRPLAISRDAVAALLRPLRGWHPGFTDDLERLFNGLREISDGTVVPIRDLASVHAVDRGEALRLVARSPERTAALETLWDLFGKKATVRREGAWGNAVLDYKNTLPSGINPVLVLDASARVRTAYELWEQRGGLTRLPSASKCYRSLNIHWWDTGGGKSGLRQNAEAILNGVASTMRAKPGERWLVVYHRTGLGFDFKSQLHTLLRESGVPVDFVHWGAHDATNKFVEIPNVVLAGTLFQRPSYYESLARLALGRPSYEGPIDMNIVREIERGEHRHLILQAVCRAAVRKSVGDGCPPTSAYIIASSATGIPSELPTIFPGAHITSWEPCERTLRGRAGETLRYVEERLGEDPTCHVPFREAMDHIGWNSTKDFLREIRRHPNFVSALDKRSIEEWGLKKRATCFRLRPSSEQDDLD